jgi:tRNA(fMet)-specific endonuclease VapC
MMRYILDANAVIDLLNDADSNLANRVRRESPNDIAISAIVSHELFYGAFRSGRLAQNVSKIDALQFAVLEFDKEDARQSGAIRAFLASRGTPIGPYDALIAGQAIARNMILITRNMNEFGRVPGLRAEDWSL